MRINMQNKIIFVDKLLWIERDPSTKVVTLVFDGGIKLVTSDKVDFDKIRNVLQAQDTKNSKPVDQRSVWEMVFGSKAL